MSPTPFRELLEELLLQRALGATASIGTLGKCYFYAINRSIGNPDAEVLELSSSPPSRIPVMVAVVFLISCLVMTAPAVSAALTVITPSTADRTILEDLPTGNAGGGYFYVEWPSPASWRALVKFDLSSIPPGATINAAYLLLYYIDFDYVDPAGATIMVNRVTKDWVEQQVTWNSYKTGSPWTTPGGDYVPDGAASAIVPANPPQWMTWTVTDIVKAWTQGGQPNYGFLLRNPNEGGTGPITEVNFAARQNRDPSLRPVLKVDWTSNPVGGMVMPTNKLEILTPYIALAGLVAVISMVVGVKRRRD